MAIVCAAYGRLNAQAIDPQYDERFKKLEQQLTALQQHIFITDSLTYSRQYQQAQDGYFLFRDLVIGTEDFADDIRNSALLLKLMNLNNPSSMQLRKKIMDEIQGLVENRIDKLLDKDTARKRSFFNIVRNIFNNPIINGAIHAIPIGGPVMNIVSAISSIVAPRIQTNTGKVLGTEFVKNINLDLQGLIEASPLKDIADRIMPYLQFYDSLYALNNRIQSEMAFIKDRNEDIRRFAREQSYMLKQLTGWSGDAATNVLTDRFNKKFVYPAMIRNNPLYTPEYKLRMDSMVEIALPAIQYHTRMLQLKLTYEGVFERIKSDYLRIMKNFAGKSSLLKEYLEPSITQLEELDRPAEVLVSMNMGAPPEIPAAVNPEQARQIQSLPYKYRDHSDAKRTGAIKKILMAE